PHGVGQQYTFDRRGRPTGHECRSGCPAQLVLRYSAPMGMPLHVRILIGAVVGAGLGILANALLPQHHDPDSLSPLEWTIKYVTWPVGTIFLRLLLMLVAPLMFAALVMGVSELGDLRRLGRIGVKTLAYTVIVSAIAVLIGIVLVNTLQPGAGMSDQTRQRIIDQSKPKQQPLPSVAPKEAPASGMDLIVNIVPSNPIKAIAEGDYLAWMFFALMIGIALSIVRSPGATVLRQAIAGLYDVTFWLIQLVIWLAPIGVAALLFNLTAQFGYELLNQLAKYVGVVLLGLAIHQFVIYSIAVKTLGRMNPLAFFRAIQEAMLTAFSTASSATLPTALKVAEQNLLLPSHVSRFVLTVGATANQNGTALFEGVTVLFLAQVYGIELTLSQQFTVILISILGGIGTAGVPGGSLPVVLMIMARVGVPTEGIGLILGVDRLLDMCRTTLNVTGDLAAAVVVARGEANHNPPHERAPLHADEQDGK
ncbi:MAG: dicarboxylate/amino acid:cation symporter, partial [Phycisphaerales bacterium]|nr:dicarboxylate/amino acid:cation symporter [Phycisphaerales bacterium]